jgi:hypothetical protein
MLVTKLRILYFTGSRSGTYRIQFRVDRYLSRVNQTNTVQSLGIANTFEDFLLILREFITLRVENRYCLESGGFFVNVKIS